MATARWVLPAADGGGPRASPPSVQGRLTAIVDNTLVLAAENRQDIAKIATTIAIDDATDMFGAYGGIVDRADLRAGQYAWVWFVKKNARRSGTPPCAAVVMVFSMDPGDQPSDESRWGKSRK